MSEQDQEQDFEASLIRAMGEMLAAERGEIQLHTRTVDVAAPNQETSAPPPYDGARVRALRAKLLLSPEAFAAALNVSLRTLQAWERDARRPEGPTLRLLEIAEKQPEALFSVVRQVG